MKVSGARSHFRDEGTDTGPIILQKAVEVRTGGHSEKFCRDVWIYRGKILPRAIDLIANGKVKVEGPSCDRSDRRGIEKRVR